MTGVVTDHYTTEERMLEGGDLQMCPHFLGSLCELLPELTRWPDEKRFFEYNLKLRPSDSVLKDRKIILI